MRTGRGTKFPAHEKGPLFLVRYSCNQKIRAPAASISSFRPTLGPPAASPPWAGCRFPSIPGNPAHETELQGIDHHPNLHGLTRTSVCSSSWGRPPGPRRAPATGGSSSPCRPRSALFRQKRTTFSSMVWRSPGLYSHRYHMAPADGDGRFHGDAPGDTANGLLLIQAELFSE